MADILKRNRQKNMHNSALIFRSLNKMKYMTRIEKSRGYFILEGVTGIGQFSLTTGAFLAGFVSFLGGSESLNGMMGVIPAAVGIFQLLSSLLIKESGSRKTMILKWAIWMRILLSSVYFVPFIMMKAGGSRNTILISYIVCFVAAFSISSLISPFIAGWLIDLTPLNIRGRYLALRDRISLSVIALCTVGLGRYLDYYKSQGQEFTGFLVVGLVLSIMGILNVYALWRIEDVESDEVIIREPLQIRIMKPLRDQVFRKIILFSVLWNFSLFIGLPYIAVYMVEELELSYTYMMSMAVIGTVTRVVFAGFWGKIADRKSWLHAGGLSIICIAIAHILWSFVAKENSFYMVPVLNVIGGFAWAGGAISIFNIQFLYTDNKIRTISLGVNAALGGIIGLISVRIGGWIMSSFSVQVIFFLSGLCLLGTVYYMGSVLTKLEVRN